MKEVEITKEMLDALIEQYPNMTYEQYQEGRKELLKGEKKQEITNPVTG